MQFIRRCPDPLKKSSDPASEVKPASASFNPDSSLHNVVDCFSKFGGKVVESKQDAPAGWCVGQLSVGELVDPRLFAFESPLSFYAASRSLKDSCGKAVTVDFI